MRSGGDGDPLGAVGQELLLVDEGVDDQPVGDGDHRQVRAADRECGEAEEEPGEGGEQHRRHQRHQERQLVEVLDRASVLRLGLAVSIATAYAPIAKSPAWPMEMSPM